METIDFSCLVRVLNRQRLTSSSVAAGQQQLNKTASQFLSVVRNNGANKSDCNWMKLRLSDRGLRLFHPPPPPSSSSSPSTASAGVGGRLRDDGFESSDYDDDHHLLMMASPNREELHHQQHRNNPHRVPESESSNSGSSTSGVNSSSSDIEESCCCCCCCCSATNGPQEEATPTPSDLIQSSIRCPLDHILSCQLPPALAHRNVCLITLRASSNDGGVSSCCGGSTPPLSDALDVVALECAALEPARILTMLCQKIISSYCNNLTKSSSDEMGSDASDASFNKPVVVPIQPWSERSIKSVSSTPSDSSTTDSLSEDVVNVLPPPPPLPPSPTPPPPLSMQSTTTSPSMSFGSEDFHNSSASSHPGSARNLIRKLERQHSAWMERSVSSNNRSVPASELNESSIKSKTLTRTSKSNRTESIAPSVSNTGGNNNNNNRINSSRSGSNGLLRRSDTMLLTPVSGLGVASRVISLETPEFMQPQNQRRLGVVPLQQQQRWPFDRMRSSQQQQPSSLPAELSHQQQRSGERRGRSTERRVRVVQTGPESSSSPVRPSAPEPQKVKRDQSKTRSFLMKWTGTNSSSTAGSHSKHPGLVPVAMMEPNPPPPLPPQSVDATDKSTKSSSRGRSLIRFRTSANSSNSRRPTPPSSTIGTTSASASSSSTFLIPTKSGHERKRFIYPKEAGFPLPPPPHLHQQQQYHSQQQQQQQQQQMFHLVHQPQAYHRPMASYYNPWAWPEGAAAAGYDPNNNGLHHHPHHQQQWIYFQPLVTQPPPHMPPPPPPQATGINSTTPLTKAEMKRLMMQQRSRSQSPGQLRRNPSTRISR